MHAIALRDEDIQQMAARVHAAPDFDGEPARDGSRASPRVWLGGSRARSRALPGGVRRKRLIRRRGAGGVRGGAVRANSGRNACLSDALDADHLASFAEEQFALGDAARAAALKLADARREGRGRGSPPSAMATALEPLLVAAAGGGEARLVLAAMLEGGYGTSDSAPKPGRALYHRLMAAASGDPMARLAMGAATVLGNHRLPVRCQRRFRGRVLVPVRVSRASPAVDSAAPERR